MSRLPKDQDCHELWSRMMKKALRERMARSADDHSTSADARNSSTTHPKVTAPSTAAHNITTVSSHTSSSIYPKNTVAGSNPRGTAAASSDLTVPALLGQQRCRTGYSISLQQLTAGHHDKLAVHSSSSSSLHTSDSGYMTYRPALTRPTATSSSHAYAPTSDNH